MSTIRNSALALAATVALGAGAAATATPAEAATSCSTVYCSMSYAKKINRTLSYGSTGAQVRDLQLALRGVHFNVKVTGRFDAQTRTNVLKYQSSRKITRTGTVGSATRHALRVGAGNKSVVRRSSTLASSSSSSVGAQAVSFAYAQLGKPYVYGATGPSAYDCSGLTSAAWRAAGVSIPRTSYGQAGLRSVSLSALQPGDIVVFYGGGHVGIYIGGGKVIHAPRTGDVVRVASLRSMPATKAVRPA